MPPGDIWKGASMIEIKSVLCPVDFSDFSRRALSHAVALAKWYEAELTLLHVAPSIPPPLAYSEVPPPLAVSHVGTEQLQQDLEIWAETARAEGVPITAIVTSGEPVREIVAKAEHMHADLLVMGTHGASGFERLLLGSVAEKVLRKAPCPVLTVPRAEPAEAADRVVFKSLLCAVDFSEASADALAYALSLAQEADAHLTVLHVVETVPLGVGREYAHFQVPEFNLYLEKDAAEQLHTMVPAEAHTWCEVRELVATGKPYVEILRVAAEVGAELIVMGSTGRGAIDRLLFGSTTQHVLRQARCPVLTMRARHAEPAGAGAAMKGTTNV
jgi:nucleotide-binding universal stress UspA family protein